MKYRSCPICGGFCGGGWRTGRYPLCNRVPANHSFKKNGVSKIMTDKELLELAAKAAGIKGGVYMDETPNLGIAGIYVFDLFGLATSYWNPLTDDGDALRLAVKLGMRISIYSGQVVAEALPPSNSESVEYGSDSAVYAATRRAIVRAATEIWNNMND